MNAVQLISGITQVAFVAIFVLSVSRAIRRPLRPNVDAALFFGAVAAAIMEGLLLAALRIKPGWLVTILSSGLILSLPYLLLRLLNDYAGVRRWLMRAAELGLVLCVVGVLWLPGQRVVTAGVIAYFAGFAGYTGVGFGRAALRTEGVTRRRMLAVAAGSLLLGLAILVAGLRIAFPGQAALLSLFGTVLPLLSGVAYFLGFTPPAPVRRLWQETDVTAFLRTVVAASVANDVSEVTQTLEAKVKAVVGAESAAIVLLDRSAKQGGSEQRSIDGRYESVIPTGLSAKVLSDSKPRLVVQGDPDMPAGRAGALMAQALRVGGKPLGIIVANTDRIPMFAEDDLALFDLVAEQTALAIQSVQRNEDLRHQAELLDLAHDAILVLDIETRAITYWNRGAEELYGWTRGEALGRVSYDLLRTRFAESRSAIEETLLLHGRWDGELTQESKERGEVVVSSRWALQRDQLGSPTGILEINTDVSERKRAMEALRNTNAELEGASRHKSQFLANMSHELRTPLNAIIGFSEILLDEEPGTYDDESRHRFLQMVNEGGRNLLALVNDILDLSKVEAGQMTLRLERLAVADVIDLVLETAGPLAAAKEISIRRVGDSQVEVDADRSKLRQMLLNLVSNAIKFTPDGGAVTVGCESRGEEVELVVADSGIGIAAEDLDLIFGEFRQVEAGPSRGQQGTGLGLALTKRFAELHQGSVRVESELGKGSRFVITLPRETVDADLDTAPELEAEASDDAGRPLVLVIEDDAPAAHLISTQLRLGGYRPEVARNGQEALDKARRLKPVAVTLDIILPGIDGWEVLKALKGDPATSEVPVIVVSIVENEALGRALGAVDYFVKPVESGALLAKLESLTFLTKVKLGEIRVLAIDDEAPALDLIEETLRPLGFQVIRASGGREGIEIAASVHPHLILTDLQMPGMSGFEVVSALRADPATSAIPILVLTAQDLTPADKSALQDSVAAILHKDSGGSVDLVSWVNQVTGRRDR